MAAPRMIEYPSGEIEVFKKDKESWNENVQKGAFKAFHMCMCNNAENWTKWKGKNETRKGTTKEGSKAFEEFYQDLGTMNGKCRINNFAKHRKKKSKFMGKEN